MENTVAIVKCGEYSKAKEGIHNALELIGGMGSFVKKGDKVVIKPNFVSRKSPDEAATTHPLFLRAVIEEVEAVGAKVIIAESPGGPYNTAMLKSVYTGCEADKAIEGTSAQLNYNTDFREVSYAEGKILKSIPIISPILDADVIISLPKLKTHAMTSYTGAVKNLFGVIPGTHKAELHFRLDDREAFCSMLVDLCECVKPALSIMDAIVGMEGDGPTAGQNRFIGLTLASANPHALDMAACRIIGYKPEEIPTVREGISRGLVSENTLKILGEQIQNVAIPDFKKPESHFNLLKLLSLPPSLNEKLKNILSAEPKVNYKECIGCGKCAASCPPKAMDMSKGKPVIDKEKCIKCFCCQELCPKKAVKIHRPLANRLMLKLLK